jgi:hypothetical protein
MLLELARAQAPVPPEALGTVAPAKAAPVKTPARKRASRVAARA